MKNILFIGTYPIINSFWFYSDLLVTIDKVDKNNYWFLNNYINVYCTKSQTCEESPYNFKNINPRAYIHFFNPCTHNILSQFYACPFVDMEKVCIDEKDFTEEIIGFIKRNINLGKYILLMVDRQYLEIYHYATGPKNHEILIYGYDDSKQLLYFCDNYSDGKYRTDLSCSYISLVNAYKNCIVHSNNLNFYKTLYLLTINEDTEYSLNLLQIKEQLDEYLNPKYLTNVACDYYSGIDVSKQVKEYLVAIQKGMLPLSKDVRTFHVLYDHKKAMQFRIHALIKNTMFQNKYNEWSEVVEKAKIVECLFLKYIITHNIEIIKKMQEYLDLIIKLEYNILTKFMHDL